MELLKVKNISVYYGEVCALRDVSFEIKKGEVISVLGANGAGKTTLINTLSGILQPKSGEIWFDGELISEMSPDKIVKKRLIQIPEGRKLFPLMTVEENLLIGSYTPGSRKKRKENLEGVLEILPRLYERKNQVAGTMSGGEQQMLAIGRALMGDPILLAFDEPSLGLAPKLVSQVLDLINVISKQGITVLLVEQNVQHALEISTRGYVFENGSIVIEGSSPELLDNPHIKKAYLGL